MKFLALLVYLISASNAFELAALEPQIDISRRATYNGGWVLGLVGSTCPAEAPVACDTMTGVVNPTCCPSGNSCFGSVAPYCCPTSADCTTIVTNFPACANSTWNMYMGPYGNYFCCEQGQFGVLPISGYAGICAPNDLTVAQSQIAKPATQVGGAAVTSVTTQSGAPKSTVLVTSTLSGGGAVTITSGIGTSTSTSNTGSGSNGGSNGGNSGSVTLSKGAIIGIGVGVALLFIIVLALSIWCCMRSRKRRQAGNGMSNPAGQAMGPAPAYAPVPQQAGQHPYQQPYVVSPISEYKTPAAAEMHGNPSPPPVGGFAPPNGPPPNQHNQQQQQQQGGFGVGHYSSPTPSYSNPVQSHQLGPNLSPSPHQSQMMYGRAEAPGAAPPMRVEAPNSWERGI